MRVFSGRQAWADVQAGVRLLATVLASNFVPLRQDHGGRDEEDFPGTA